MNNKGQTLVTFIIILPILLIILALVVDLGFIYIEKRNIDNNVNLKKRTSTVKINFNDCIINDSIGF